MKILLKKMASKRHTLRDSPTLYRSLKHKRPPSMTMVFLSVVEPSLIPPLSGPLSF